MASPKKAIRVCRDIEWLLQWTYREELPKRQTSSAEGIWDRIGEVGKFGQIDHAHGAAQRYPHFGLPHPDAIRIEAAVGALPDADIDWTADAWNILGELVALTNVNDPTPQHRRRISRATWVWPRSTREGQRDRSRQEATLEPPRDVLLVRSLHTSALVTMHAKMGTRPKWRDIDPHSGKEIIPETGPSPAPSGGNPKIIGECKGKNLYTIGAYCPVRWSPSPIAIAEARVDYLAWWRGMRDLAVSLQLGDFEPMLPAVPEMPWRDEAVEPTVRAELWPKKSSALPLKPSRKLAGPPQRPKRYGPVRKIEKGQ